MREGILSGVPSPRRGRPTNSDAKKLNELVLAAAAIEFCERGFDGARMEAIAKTAGVTKRTLYGRYPDKRALFVDVVRRAIARYDDELIPAETEDDDLEAALLAMGRAGLERAVDPENIRLKRMLMNDPNRFPQLSEMSHLMLWSSGHVAVVELLKRHQERGTIRINNADVAAAQFLVLVEALPARLADFGIFRTKSENERHLRDALALFLDAVRP